MKKIVTVEKAFQECISAHAEWVKAHIDEFDKYLAEGQGHLFLKLRYVSDTVAFQDYLEQLNLTNEDEDDSETFDEIIHDELFDLDLD